MNQLINLINKGIELILLNSKISLFVLIIYLFCYSTYPDSNARVAEAEKNLGLQKELFEAKSDIALLRSEGDSLKSMMISYNEQFAMETSTIAQVLSALGNR